MLTGPDFSDEHVLDDGTHVTLRHVRPDDAEKLRRAFDRLSPSSRYRRFQSAVASLSDRTLHYLTHVDGRDHVAIVATTAGRGDGDEVGLGIARFIRSAEDHSVAEAAVTVIDEVQHKGLGRILGVALGRAAIERGVRRFRGQILTDNEPVRRLLDEVGAVVHTPTGNGLMFDVDLGPPEEPIAGRPLAAVLGRIFRAVFQPKWAQR